MEARDSNLRSVIVTERTLKMETLSQTIRVSLPNYLKALPVPESIGGFFKLTRKSVTDHGCVIIVNSVGRLGRVKSIFAYYSLVYITVQSRNGLH